MAANADLVLHANLGSPNVILHMCCASLSFWQCIVNNGQFWYATDFTGLDIGPLPKPTRDKDLPRVGFEVRNTFVTAIS